MRVRKDVELHTMRPQRRKLCVMREKELKTTHDASEMT